MMIERKVLLSSAVLTALAFGFAGCADDAGNAFNGKKVDFDNSYVFINENDANDVQHANSKDDTKKGYKNVENTKKGTGTTNGYYYRAFNKLAAKHYGATCVITLNPQSTETNDGVAGFVFDMTENGDDTYNFIVAAVRYDSKKIQTYISKYTNALIKDNNFSKEINFTDKDGIIITTTENDNKAVEKELLKGSGKDTYFSFNENDFSKTQNKDGENQIVVVVKVTQDEETGDYTVSYFKSLEDSKAGTNPVKSETIKDSDTAETGYNQEKMAMYANIKPAQHFVCDFSFKDKVGADIPFEDEIIVE